MTDQKEKAKKRKKSLIEWGVIIGVIAFLYLTGLHTSIIGTLQKGLLATGLIKPSIPSVTDTFPEANRDFYMADEEGQVISLANFDGEVVFMNIWATWCPPCIAEMPSINKLYQQFDESDNVKFVLVSMDEDFEKAKQFMEKRGFDMPIYHYRTKVPGTYESSVIPTTYVISGDGKLMMEKQGLAKYDTSEFEQFLRDLAEI
ncbi:TlpA family protein disulfide reductase [Rhodohalobacter barkolensis]|uniref:Thioredoxin n=1 Tax=Rhodohalobacter barkolensis TaxID=2053187 RepID=A0A2N0VGQ7_9BACT|nr:TlpA disulfide reductase family protein [Rhodohalobacter barkolensis]PKD43396.1 thioredoxin [Rhodohalobacter barkolensis]